jgi:hypothetical protein
VPPILPFHKSHHQRAFILSLFQLFHVLVSQETTQILVGIPNISVFFQKFCCRTLV